MNNKRLLSTSLSLACHTLILIIAFNLVFTPPSVSAPMDPPILIHVHLDARPFSPSMGNAIQMDHNLPRVSQMPMKRVNPLQVKQRQAEHQHMAMSKPMPYHKPVVSKDDIITVARQNGLPSMHAPPQRERQKTLFSSQEVLKDMVMADRSMPATIVPVTDLSNNLQNPVQPSMTSQMPSIQGATPFLPFNDNGTGEDIKSYLGYELYTYEDPSDHMKYFRLSIKVEEMPGSLVSIPKEINFLVDASNSIGLDTFEQFQKKGGQALHELGGSDKFNIEVFNDQVYKMKDAAVSSDSDNVQQGEEFLDSFRVGSSTDLYDTVLKNVEAPHLMKPSYIFLISDGQPTQGLTDSLQFINKISAINQGRVPIFGMGAGWANKYLMNFLTFTNHGWAEFVPLNDTTGSILQLYHHIQDPILTNLRYRSIGLDNQEIYPKLLPDLFKGAEFVLYGQYRDQSDFLFQLRGNSLNSIKQYVIKDNLANGLPGDRTIAQEWAMRKIYDLIGKLQYDQNNQGIIDEINQLAMKFDLKIPQYKAKG